MPKAALIVGPLKENEERSDHWLEHSHIYKYSCESASEATSQWISVSFFSVSFSSSQAMNLTNSYAARQAWLVKKKKVREKEETERYSVKSHRVE